MDTLKTKLDLLRSLVFWHKPDQTNELRGRFPIYSLSPKSTIARSRGGATTRKKRRNDDARETTEYELGIEEFGR